MTQRTLALFDLDYTLLDGDSEDLWCRYLFAQQIVDDGFIAHMEEFDRLYRQGELDLHTYEAFLLSPCLAYPFPEICRLRSSYLQTLHDVFRPYMLERLAWHRAQNHLPILITAANNFVAEPIAAMLGFQDLICTQLEMRKDGLTGRISGVPAYQHGKVIRLASWLRERKLSLKESWCYSDSHNDIPLLELADHPVMVTPDDRLRAHGVQRGWKMLSPC